MAFYGREEIFEFRDFVDRDSIEHPNYGNFWMYFIRDRMLSEFLRAKPFFQRFLDDYPDLDDYLCEKMKSVLDSKNKERALVPYEEDLYSVYLIMRNEYGASNEDCFS